MFRTPRHSCVLLAALMLTGAERAFPCDCEETDFATEAISYDQGWFIWDDYISGEPFDNPETATGRPTVDTTGDRILTPPDQAVPITPNYAAFRHFEIVSIGEGGHLVLKFDHPIVDDPRNPHGIDLIVYGNTRQQTTGDFWNVLDPTSSAFVMLDPAQVFAEPGDVYVSQTGGDPDDMNAWTPFTGGPYADTFIPTLGRVFDPANPETSLGAWNLWWSVPTCPVWPLDPATAPGDFVGMTVAEYAGTFGHTAGGTGFDLAEVGLAWVQYVMIRNPIGTGFETEIDAVADVNPDLIPPDLDDDLDVDGADWERFEDCAAGPGVAITDPACLRADLNNDGDIDQDDFGRFQRCLSGEDIAANPACRR